MATSADADGTVEAGCGLPRRRKLRPLVITMGGERQDLVLRMFASELSEDFETPRFSPGVPSRDLRSRSQFFVHANNAGLLPKAEWEAIEAASKDWAEQQRRHERHLAERRSCSGGSSARVTADRTKINPSEAFFECLNNVPVEIGGYVDDGNNGGAVLPRRGSAEDVKLHYSVELWRKAKTVNRGRAVLACTLAHLIAMKRMVAEGFDLILEDNVRALRSFRKDGSAETTPDHKGQWSSAATRIRESIRASEECERKQSKVSEHASGGVAAPIPGRSHMRMYGWLGPIANLRWILSRHCPKRKYRRQSEGAVATSSNDDGSSATADGDAGLGDAGLGDSARHERPSFFPFPTSDNLNEDLAETELQQNLFTPHHGDVVGDGDCDDNDNDNDRDCNAQTGPADRRSMPGGTALWGAYSYWVSPQGYEALLRTLRCDVGAMLWKSKRQRYYTVKPIDKILPRSIRSVCGEGTVHVTTHPCFFRAPMLTSKIHSQWDPEFCKGTEYQLRMCGNLRWSDLWLSDDEQRIVSYRQRTGKWVTPSKIAVIGADETEG